MDQTPDPWAPPHAERSADVPWTPPGEPTRAGVPGWVVVTFLSVAGVVAVGGTVVLHVGAWFVEQSLLTLETDFPAVAWPLIAIGNALLAGLVIVPAALMIRRPKPRAVARTWAVALGCLAVLGLMRALPPVDTLYSVPSLAVVAAGLAALLALVGNRPATPAPGAAPSAGLADPSAGPAGPIPGPAMPTAAPPTAAPPSAAPAPGATPARVAGRTFAAAAAGLALLLPWWWLGALGSVTDTVLAVAAAVALGVLGGTLLSRFLWPAFAEAPMRRWPHISVAGLAAGTALALLFAGAGPSGTHLALLLTVPPTGFALAALAYPDGLRWYPGAVVIGLAALGPLAFADPEELTILLGFADVGRYTLVAALAGLLVALLAGVVTAGRAPRFVAAGLAAALAVAGAGVGATAGQPGFHGERLFAILDSQADLSGLDAVPDIDERRRRTYERLVGHAERTQRDLRRDLTERGIEFTSFYLVNAVEIPDSPVNRVWLGNRGEVDRLLASPRLRPLPFDPPVQRGPRTEAPADPVWNLRMIGAPTVWNDLKVDGTGIVVGESDSGVDGRHPALRDNYRGRTSGDDYNWYDPWNETRSPTDVGGHGTHTTATAVGRENVGVAPGAEWIGCVNLSRNLGNPAVYLTCLQFMLAPFPRGGDPLRDGDPARAADVLNNSWGCPELEGCDPSSLRPAVQALEAAGIFVVVSAGNTGYAGCGTVRDPLALYPESLTVGSVNRGGQVSDFSSRGPVAVDGSDRVKPDLVAPGEKILSAMPDGTYDEQDGTSMAGPHVAGVVALMWQANPALVGDIDGTAEILRTTARATTMQTGDDCGVANTFGAGIVDAAAAVRTAKGS